MRSFHTSFGSPIETHTSVWMKSTPLTASFGSSVMVSFAPDCAWSVLRDRDEVVGGPQFLRSTETHVHAR